LSGILIYDRADSSNEPPDREEFDVHRHSVRPDRRRRADLANLYAAWLEDDCDVETAYDGSEALEAIDGAIDVVLLDRRMPGLSGDTVLETIREQSLECRVAMVTAVEPDFDIVELGFDDYLVKPVSKDELVDIIDQLFLQATHDEQLQELFALASKKALLDQKTESERQSSSQGSTPNSRTGWPSFASGSSDTMQELLEQNSYQELCQDMTRANPFFRSSGDRDGVVSVGPSTDEPKRSSTRNGQR